MFGLFHRKLNWVHTLCEDTKYKLYRSPVDCILIYYALRFVCILQITCIRSQQIYSVKILFSSLGVFFSLSIPRPLQESQDLKCLSTRSVAKPETSFVSSFYEKEGEGGGREAVTNYWVPTVHKGALGPIMLQTFYILGCIIICGLYSLRNPLRPRLSYSATGSQCFRFGVKIFSRSALAAEALFFYFTGTRTRSRRPWQSAWPASLVVLAMWNSRGMLT